mgnify:FL=1
MIVDKIISIPGLFIAIIFHEVAHGYVAYRLGDPTAKREGRLTLNPLKHIDIVGFLFLLIFKFGWAKPVPINPLYFKNRKRDILLVSIAGPLTNLAIAFILAILISFIGITNGIITQMIVIAIWYNIMLGIFNLLPFPPLDGSKIVASLLPEKYEILFYKYEKYLYFILIILIVTDTVDKILGPFINIALSVLLKIIS